MRATLANADLSRYAGRFVWLELDYDKPVNQEFIARHGVGSYPSFFVLDPKDERATATHLGVMTLTELRQFLDQGERGVIGGADAPAAVALARGDEMLDGSRPAEAAAAYREALRLAKPGSPERIRAVLELTWTLAQSREAQACAETAAVEAPNMPRDSAFASVVLAGWVCTNGGGPAPWTGATRKTLEPLTVEAVALPTTHRDVRFKFYQFFMNIALRRHDEKEVAKWGERWLAEIEATTPAGDDERSALDIARIDAAQLMNEPARVLPALVASERAMPKNYSASLRLAEVETAVKRYDDALAACERGLANVSGPQGQVWIMQIKAEALLGKGEKDTARKVLEEALKIAPTIGNERQRANNIRSVTQALAAINNKPE